MSLYGSRIKGQRCIYFVNTPYRQAIKMAKIGVFLRFVAQDGKKEALLKHLLATAEIASKEPGTELWTVHSSPIEPNTVWVYEAYADVQAQERHEATPAYAAAREDTGKLLAHPPQAFPLIPIGGKGL